MITSSTIQVDLKKYMPDDQLQQRLMCHLILLLICRSMVRLRRGITAMELRWLWRLNPMHPLFLQQPWSCFVIDLFSGYPLVISLILD